MSDLIPCSIVKVKYIAGNGKKATVYLEQSRIVDRGEYKFVTGYECTAQGDAKSIKGGAILHLIQMGEGVTVVPQLQSKMYGDLHDAT